MQYWKTIDGSLGFDVRDTKRAADTFRSGALQSEKGLAKFVTELRKLADDFGEVPRPSLFDPPLENRLRSIANQKGHLLASDAAWLLSFMDNDE